MHNTNPSSDRCAVPGGNEELRQLLAGQPAALVEQFLDEDSYYYDKNGWQYLLPEVGADARVLCLEARFGATVSSLPNRTGATVVLHTDASLLRLIRYRLQGSQRGDVCYVRVDPSTCALPFEDESFDAFIAHDVNGTVIGQSAGARLIYGPRLLKEIRRVLRTDGFAYFGLKNRFGYLRLLGREPIRHDMRPAGTSNRRCGKLALAAGFTRARLHPYLVEQGLVCEVLQPSGYRSRKNSFTRNERLKEFLLGRFGAPRLAPAFGLICWKGNAPPVRYERLAAGLIEQGLVRGPAQTNGFLLLPGKVIFSFGPADLPAERRIVVLPLLPRYIECRRREIEVLSRLRELPPSITRYLPVCREFDVDGVRGFVLNEIPGITIDRNVPRLEQATAHALDFLIAFHRLTARQVTVQSTNYRDVCGHICEAINALYPALQTHIARIDGLLRKKLIGRSFTLVWMHGDYKLENLILDPRSLKVQGVIDWELARRDGLPLLDTLYLLAYNRMEVTNADFLTVYDDAIVSDRLEKSERRTLARYLEAVPLSAHQQRLIKALFALHHVGCRYLYNMDDRTLRQRLFDLLAGIERTLEGID